MNNKSRMIINSLNIRKILSKASNNLSMSYGYNWVKLILIKKNILKKKLLKFIYIDMYEKKNKSNSLKLSFN
jgi:hypothetical protein